MSKLRRGTMNYSRACAKYAYFLLLDILDKKFDKVNESVAYVDILDCLYDIWADESEMLETLENECVR